MKYWEKTVEYAFLTLAINEGKADFAAPLAGALERAGDAVFADRSSFILLEFKACESGMASEHSKFTSYEDAKKALKGSDSHHFFVYGKLEKNLLTLVATTYFSRKPAEGVYGTALDCFEHGADKDTFDGYLTEFLAFRKPDERSKGGGKDISDYATVIGVDPNGVSAIACSLRDYAERFGLDVVPDQSSKPDSNGGNEGQKPKLTQKF